jgi:triphosphoribosyl-dephospho-CoA synthase
MIQERMAKLAGQLKTSNFEQLLPQIWEVDAEFKRVGINPGTTADLTVAALLAVRLERLVEGELSF